MIDKNYALIIDIIKSVLNKTPLTMPDDVDYKAIYKLSKAHSLLSIVTSGLEPTDSFKSLDINVQNAFVSHKMGSIRKMMSFDYERAQILQILDEKGIKYLPLKGVILNTLYPEVGMREFADNDIWFDSKYRNEVKEIFVERGYDVESFKSYHHDSYMKKPFFNIEMHVTMVNAQSKFFDYYQNMDRFLIKDDGNACGYHLSDEDFYIFHLVHGYKHFSQCGNGLRFLVDIYRYLQLKENTMNWEYIKQELSSIDLLQFEEEMRDVSLAIFSKEHKELTELQEKNLSYVLGSGTYGTLENQVDNKMKEYNGSRLRYIWSRLYPGWGWCKQYHPFFAYTFIFIPLLILGRIFTAIFLKRDKAMKELALSKKK